MNETAFALFLVIEFVGAYLIGLGIFDGTRLAAWMGEVFDFISRTLERAATACVPRRFR